MVRAGEPVRALVVLREDLEAEQRRVRRLREVLVPPGGLAERFVESADNRLGGASIEVGAEDPGC